MKPQRYPYGTNYDVSWEYPDAALLDFRFEVGDSFITEFALGHDPAAVLRELVQNEYDAGGHRMEVRFREDHLQIIGFGKTIDAAGWRRLSVMLGTGRAGESKRLIEKKARGIGSKNFGLRSLFLFGDLIHVRSGGKQTFLDLAKGTLPHPVPDETSVGRPGVVITVPYRIGRHGKLEPFGPEQEERALDNLSSQLSYILIKLAHPGSHKSLREVLISSERHGRSLSWRQSVSALPSGERGLKVVRRKIQLDDSKNLKPQTVEEIETQKTFALPERHRGQEVPSYFVAGGGRIRLSLSLRVRRGRPDVTAPGIYFYPLGVGGTYTGTAISVCAPFEVDLDRSQLLSPDVNSWNAWLIDEAAEMTVNVLASDWFRRFGPPCYRALIGLVPASYDNYSRRLEEGLKQRPCWPARARKAGGRPAFECAGKLVVPDSPELDGFLSHGQYLDAALGRDAEIRRLAEKCGTKVFTINSLVRLRSADESCLHLKTKLEDHEANYSYRDYPGTLTDEALQVKFARALDAQRKLSPENTQDIQNSPATLTAAKGLQKPTLLWAVEPELTKVCPVPQGERLHQSLQSSGFLRKLCKKFNYADWAEDVAGRSRAGTASPEERSALYRYVLSTSGHVGHRLRGVLHNAPVLRDHRGEWVSPSSVIVKKAPGSSGLAHVLHFPHPEYERDHQLAKLLRFRRSVGGRDIVNFARVVESRPELAPKLEDALYKHDRLLTRTVIDELKGIAFLRSSSGTLECPPSLYIRSQLNVSCVGEGALFAAGTRMSLYKKLGCREHPRAEDIVSHLKGLAAQEVEPGKPEVIYPALVEAALRERGSTDYYRQEPILWDGLGYVRPAETLIGSRHQRIFLQSVPQVSRLADALCRSYLALGAHATPKPEHWRRLFIWLSEKYRRAAARVTGPEKRALREAYGQLRDLPDGLPDDAEFLLDRRGRLHSLKDARSGSYVIDDAPELSAVIEGQGSLLSFADVEDARTLDFYRGVVGVRRLTEVSEPRGYEAGSEQPPPARFDAARILSRVHDADFASAVTMLAAHETESGTLPGRMSRNQAESRLRKVKKFSFVGRLHVRYRVLKTVFSVPAEVVVDKDTILLLAQRWSDLQDLTAQAVASIISEGAEAKRHLADPIFRLLSCRTPNEIQRYLRRRGISWAPVNASAEVDEGDEADESEDLNRIQEMVARSAAPAPTASNRPALTQSVGQRPSTPESPPSRAVRPLPPLEKVALRRAETEGVVLSQRERVNRERSATWTPPASRDREVDEETGRRGEELIYRREVERVTALGYPESRVVRTFETDPGADHDILSVHEDGGDLWIEVKSTAGRGGSFEWSINEFGRALQERERYVLWRVYEARSETPSCKSFRDPISLLLRKVMRVNVANFYAEVEPLNVTN